MKNQIIQQFKLTNQIAQNGFYEIWEAENNLGQKANIKLLKSEFLSNPRVNEEFKREAKQVAHLTHPGITRVLGFEEGSTTLAIIKEYHGGVTLKENLRKKGPFKELEALKYITSLFESLEFVHSKGYAIGNLNYENVVFTTDFGIKINDFSKDTSEVMGFATPVSSFGPESICFKSPEQLQGLEASSKKSDVYSAGIILYTMLRGKVPFNPGEQSLSDIYRDITIGNLPKVTLTAPTANFLAKLINPKPSDRFPTAQDALIACHSLLQPAPAAAAANIGFQAAPTAISASTVSTDFKLCVNPKCGKPMAINGKFCGSCGTKWQDLNMIACKFCTSPIPSDANYCPYCENPLN